MSANLHDLPADNSILHDLNADAAQCPFLNGAVKQTAGTFSSLNTTAKSTIITAAMAAGIIQILNQACTPFTT